MLLDLASLDPAWRSSFDLAWEAWRSGTIPIGAVVTNPDGALVARGRNRIFESTAPPRQISGSWLAHAEVNALLQLAPDGCYDGFTITSTTEPCLLCAGAIIMSLRGRVIIRYAAADPIAGGIDVVGSSAQGRRRELVVERLEEPGFVAFAELLTLAESIRRAPDGIVARRYSATRPEFTACAEELEVALRPFLASDACLHDVLGDVAAVLLNHPRAT